MVWGRRPGGLEHGALSKGQGSACWLLAGNVQMDKIMETGITLSPKPYSIGEYTGAAGIHSSTATNIQQICTGECIWGLGNRARCLRSGMGGGGLKSYTKNTKPLTLHQKLHPEINPKP